MLEHFRYLFDEVLVHDFINDQRRPDIMQMIDNIYNKGTRNHGRTRDTIERAVIRGKSFEHALADRYGFTINEPNNLENDIRSIEDFGHDLYDPATGALIECKTTSDTWFNITKPLDLIERTALHHVIVVGRPVFVPPGSYRIEVLFVIDSKKLPKRGGSPTKCFYHKESGKNVSYEYIRNSKNHKGWFFDQRIAVLDGACIINDKAEGVYR